ncbi:MAG: hypothetical protein BGO37_13505 [Cellulomonas sp. 73-92]|uniref:hypothetical protein n=1 Tax=Cellulomonas sp. 73-92 TaxID=1895740 RepID=UPI00092AB059|nr:hypothetical protein [Cellulomonas sp. 73-92]OJV82975.1 MAG: hypothetical protein BGO37_13505 [Cellulomonas sp. 73-92]
MAGSERDARARRRGALEATADSLTVLAAARRRRESAETRELDAVRAARDAGASWGDIGDLYGLTKQGAQQRFKPLLGRIHPFPDDSGTNRPDAAPA